MGIKEYEDYIMIKCSPIHNLDGLNTFLVNISVVTEDMTAKFCGFQLPQYHLSYNDGFSNEEVSELKKKIEGMETELLEKAKNTVGYKGAPDGDIEYIY